jgi:hypothetical protein
MFMKNVKVPHAATRVCYRELLHEKQVNPLWGSWVQVSPRLRAALVATPVPGDFEALKAIKRSPLALDLYFLATWEAYRASRTRKTRFVSWRQISKQLGMSYTDDGNARKAIKAALRMVRPFLHIHEGERLGGLEILPSSRPVISPKPE